MTRLQIQLSVLYLSAFWFKAGGETWRDGTAISYALRIENFQRFPLPDALLTSELMSNVFTFGTLALELSLGLLVWNRRLRPWVLLAGVGLHLGIDYAIRVGFFSYAILVLYLAFIPPETMDRWLSPSAPGSGACGDARLRSTSTSVSAFAAPGRVAIRRNLSSLRGLRPRGDGARKGTGVSGMGVRSQALRAIRRRGRLVSDQSGQTLVEYALIIVMVGVSSIPAARVPRRHSSAASTARPRTPSTRCRCREAEARPVEGAASAAVSARTSLHPTRPLFES